MIQATASASGATAVSTSRRSNGWSRSQSSFQVLVVPDDLAGVGVEREGRVVVQVREVGPAEHELRRRRGDRRADVDEVQLGVVARHHPRADVPAFLERHVSPRLVPRLARPRDGPAPPQLLSGAGVVGGDDAGVGGGGGAAAPARDDLAVRDDRPRRLQGRVHGVVEDLGLPDHVAGDRVEGHQVVVAGGVEQQAVVDGDGPLGGGQPAHVLAEIVGQIAPVLPDEVPGRRVDGLDDVAGVRHVEHPAVGEGRALLAAPVQGAGPHQAQVAHVAAVDLVEGGL